MYRLINVDANAKRIKEIENCFGTDGQPLALPGRILIGEATLTKVCRKKPKPRKFFLFNDVLVYGNIFIDKKKYYNQHIIPLEEIQIEPIEDTDELINAWLIKGRVKSFAVFSPTSEEKKDWISYMNNCIKERLREIGKNSPTSVHAPVWVPDSKALICMSCNINKFSVINRRHHCRNCGKVICDGCSNKKIPLLNESQKERVCTNCFDSLTKNNN